jgi:ABC-type transporter Mla subunit MlaD
MFRRILGAIILAATLVVLVILIAAAFYIGPAIDSISSGLDNSLALTVDALNTVSDTLSQTQSTLSAVNDSMDTAAMTTTTLSQTVADTIPLLDQISFLVAEQAPSNIEAVQATVPNIAAVAGVVDTALTRLSDFEINQTIPIPLNPVDIQFDLGIEYDPVEPFDETMLTLGTSLDGLPEALRALEGQLAVSADNLETLSNNLDAAAGDIGAVNAEVAAFIPLLDQYLALLDQVIGSIEQLNAQIAANLATVKSVATILPIALALTQLAPLVVGWDLLLNKPETAVVVENIEEAKEADENAETMASDKREED